MQNKTFSKRVLVTFCLSLIVIYVLIGFANYYLDPFYYFHDTFFDHYTGCVQQYQNYGALKNFKYDSVIMGSSTANNFDADLISEELDCDSIQVSLAGGQIFDCSKYFSRLFSNQNEIKNVVIGVDITTLIAYSGSTAFSYDGFMSDEPLSFLDYLFNKSIFMKYGYHTLLDNRFSTYNEMYHSEYSTDNNPELIYGLENIIKDVARPDIDTEKTPVEEEQLLTSIENNVEVLSGTVHSHPNTEFYIVLMPSNMVYWDHLNRTGYINYAIIGIRKLYEALSTADNVKLYSFVDDTSVITDFDLYWDMVHTSSEVQKRIALDFVTGEHLVNINNFEDQLIEFHKFLNNYDYDSLYANALSE